MTRLKKIRQVLIYTLCLNIAVSVSKIIYGYSIDSISMLSDGFHSFGQIVFEQALNIYLVNTLIFMTFGDTISETPMQGKAL